MIVALASGAIGVSIGLIGIGGIFLVPLLIASGLPLREAIGTSLATFVVTGIVATLSYAYAGAIDWRAAAATSAGSVLTAPFAAGLAIWLPAPVVSAIFAIFVIVVGVGLLRPQKLASSAAPPASPGIVTLVGCGALTGIGSGLTGVGGPAILVPLLVALRVPVAAAVGISQPNQIVASAAGAMTYLGFGLVDARVGGTASACAALGVVCGTFFHRRANPTSLRRVMAIAFLVLGAYLALRLRG